jgi:catechol 2,3-dioxygenase-like lactoylglutathione lyase family enzyme
MIDHVAIQCPTVEASARWYDAVLEPLGAVASSSSAMSLALGSRRSRPWLGPQTTGEGLRETHIALLAPDRAAVRAFYAAALSAGATSLHEPKVWPEYHPDYYGAFVRDPDGNNVEAVTRQPE